MCFPFAPGMRVFIVHAMPRDGGMLDSLQDSIAKSPLRVGRNAQRASGTARNRKIARTNSRQRLVFSKPEWPGAPPTGVEILPTRREDYVVGSRLARFYRESGCKLVESCIVKRIRNQRSRSVKIDRRWRRETPLGRRVA